MATSGRPDESVEWLSEVCKETTTQEMLGDAGGFATHDAKIFSAVTNVLEGDSARQIGTFKQREGNENRLVRGRQVLWMLDAYTATNALHCSGTTWEDLLNVVMINDNLLQFIRNWDTVNTDGAFFSWSSCLDLIRLANGTVESSLAPPSQVGCSPDSI